MINAHILLIYTKFPNFNICQWSNLCYIGIIIAIMEILYIYNL